MATFKEKLSCLMRSKGFNQAKTAALIGVAQRTVSDWLSGSSYPRPDKIAKISEIFSIDLEILRNDSMDLVCQKNPQSMLFSEQNLNMAASFGANIENRLSKLESGMAQILEFLKNENPKSLKINSPNRSQCDLFDQTDNTVAHLKSSETANSVSNLDTLGKRIEKMEAVLAKLIDAANAGNRAASLDEIAEARKMADMLSADIAARKRKKNA